MARTLNQIKQSLYSSFLENSTLESLYGFNPLLPFENQFSKLSIEYNLFAIIAFAIWTFEQILMQTMDEITLKIKLQQVHSMTWYSTLAKNFQLGHALPWGEVEYEVIDDEAKIVKYCAVSKTPGGLRIKIAGLEGDALTPISVANFNAFKSYMEKTKAAGDELFYVNEVADDLKLVYNIYYDPLVLNELGQRVDDSLLTPVPDAINEYLKTIDFNNGRLIPTSITDCIQSVSGVIVPELIECATKYALFPYAPVAASGIVPDAGYIRIESLILNYIPWEI